MCRYQTLEWSCKHSRTFRLSTCRGTKQTWRQDEDEFRRVLRCTGKTANFSIQIPLPCKDCCRPELLRNLEAQDQQSEAFFAEDKSNFVEVPVSDPLWPDILDLLQNSYSRREKFRLRCERVRNWIRLPERQLPPSRWAPARTVCALPSKLSRDLDGNPAWKEDGILIERRVRAHLVE